MWMSRSFPAGAKIVMQVHYHKTGKVETDRSRMALYFAKSKPEQVIPKIVEGQVENFIKESCLLEQPYWREPKTTVHDLIAENISKLQENITVRRFARFNVRES